jgi:hypothetical protein
MSTRPSLPALGRKTVPIEKQSYVLKMIPSIAAGGYDGRSPTVAASRRRVSGEICAILHTEFAVAVVTRNG